MKPKKLTNIQIELRNKFLKKGVKMIAPETVFFSKDTRIGKNVTIEPYVIIAEKVSVGNNVRILSFSHLEGVKIENNVMKMERIKTGILILPNKEVLFKPGGLHIMFKNIKNKINLDDKKKVFFNFEKNGTIEIMMKVKKGYHSKKHNH